MRIAIKYKIILAPTVVLLMLALLLTFLQYTYWELSARQEAGNKLRNAFIALAEADMTGKRMHAFAAAIHPEHAQAFDSRRLAEMKVLHDHLQATIRQLDQELVLDEKTRERFTELRSRLDPKFGIEAERYRTAIIELRSLLDTLSDKVQKEREALLEETDQNISEIVIRTTRLSILVLVLAIAFGVIVSHLFSRQIVQRLWLLSESAGRIARGELTPPPLPSKIQDEIDDLTVSIHRMSERLIRVVSTEKLLEGAEEERRRIARDIHDQTLADLSVLARDLEELHCGACEKAARRLEEDVRRAMANLREVMDDLHPQTLDILGLGAALQSYVDRVMTREGLPEIHLYISPDVEELKLPRQIELAIYRIALEVIHNVIRHARASRYEVLLERRNDGLIFAVEDNGIGFTPSVTFSGRGLNNIRERAGVIGAQVSWSSSRFSSGTRFELIWPSPAP